MNEQATSSAAGPGRWPWQRSFQLRIILAFGGMFLLIILLLVFWLGRTIYDTNLSAAEHDLEVVAFLASNSLEDPLSGFVLEFEKYRQWEEQKLEAEEDETEDSHDDSEENNEQSADTSDSLNGDGAVTPVAIATPIPEIELPRLQQLVMRYAQDSGGRVSILNTLGEVLADSEQPISSIANQLDATEVSAALAGNEQSEVRVDPVSGTVTLFAAAPIQQGATLLGVVQLSKPMSAVTADVCGLLLNLALATVAALLLFVLLAIWVARSLVSPVRTMEAVAKLVAAGDLSQQAPVTSADELGALATAFNHMIRELGTLLEQQRAFVANASHELRTPLTNIKLRVEAVRSLGVEDLALSERYLSEVESEADRMARMAADLLDLAHLERRTAPRALPPIDLTPVLHNAASLMSLRAERAGLLLLRQLLPTLPAAAVDPEQIEEAVINLLDNSLKYTPSGGQVTLRSSMASGQMLIQVQDTGPGIPAEDLPRIFDRFYRVDKVRSRRRDDAAGLGSGAGLGLSITRTLVRQNGGDILVTSTPGALTTFTIVLPTASVA